MKRWSIFLFLIFCQQVFAQSDKYGQVIEHAYIDNDKALLHSFFADWYDHQASVAEAYRPIDNIHRTYLDCCTAFLKQFPGDTTAKFILADSQNIEILYSDKVYYSPEESESYAISNITKHVTSRQERKRLLKKQADGRLYPLAVIRYGPVVRDTLVDHYQLNLPTLRYGKICILYPDLLFTSAIERFIDLQYKDNHGGIEPWGPIKEHESSLRSKFIYGDMQHAPAIRKITFDPTLSYALISYSDRNGGGTYLMHESENEWIIVSQQETWVY